MNDHYFDSTILFDVGTDPGDAIALLDVLRDGVEAERERLQRLREGRPFPDDLDPRPAL